MGHHQLHPLDLPVAEEKEERGEEVRDLQEEKTSSLLTLSGQKPRLLSQYSSDEEKVGEATKVYSLISELGRWRKCGRRTGLNFLMNRRAGGMVGASSVAIARPKEEESSKKGKRWKRKPWPPRRVSSRGKTWVGQSIVMRTGEDDRYITAKKENGLGG